MNIISKLIEYPILFVFFGIGFGIFISLFVINYNEKVSLLIKKFITKYLFFSADSDFRMAVNLITVLNSIGVFVAGISLVIAFSVLFG